MRRLYIAPLDIHLQHTGHFDPNVTTHWLGLVDTSVNGWKELWETKGKPVVVSTQFSSERCQDLWESHPAVTTLPHPLYEPQTPISDVSKVIPPSPVGQTGAVMSNPTPLNGGVHGAADGLVRGRTPQGEETVETDGVTHMVSAGYGVRAADSIHDVHRKLAAVHPAFQFKMR